MKSKLPQTLYSTGILLVLNGTSLISDNALLALNWQYFVNSVCKHYKNKHIYISHLSGLGRSPLEDDCLRTKLLGNHVLAARTRFRDTTHAAMTTTAMRMPTAISAVGTVVPPPPGSSWATKRNNSIYSLKCICTQQKYHMWKGLTSVIHCTNIQRKKFNTLFKSNVTGRPLSWIPGMRFTLCKFRSSILYGMAWEFA